MGQGLELSEWPGLARRFCASFPSDRVGTRTSPFSSLDSDRAAELPRKANEGAAVFAAGAAALRRTCLRSNSGGIELSLACTQEFNVYFLLQLENFTPTTRVVEVIKSGLIYHSTTYEQLVARRPANCIAF